MPLREHMRTLALPELVWVAPGAVSFVAGGI